MFRFKDYDIIAMIIVIIITVIVTIVSIPPGNINGRCFWYNLFDMILFIDLFPAVNPRRQRSDSAVAVPAGAPLRQHQHVVHRLGGNQRRV